MQGGGLIRSSLLLSGLTLVSRFMGLARDLVLTARLGASATIAADAYYTALAFPNLFRRIFAEGAFSSAFIPAYTKTLTGEGQVEAEEVFLRTLFRPWFTRFKERCMQEVRHPFYTVSIQLIDFFTKEEQ